MFTTAEKAKKYNTGGGLLSKRVWQDIGKDLFEERRRRCLTIEQIKEKTEVAMWRVDKMEIGKKFNWNVLAVLLDFYGKRLEVRLVDVKEEAA